MIKSRISSITQILWVKVILVMALPAFIGLFIASLVFSHLAQSQQINSTRASKTAKAEAIASVVGQAPTKINLQAMQKLMGDDQLIINLNGKRIFTGPPNPEYPHLIIQIPMTNGYVRIISDIDSTTVFSTKLTTISALLMLFVLTSAGLGTGVLLRSIKDPLSQAITVADQLSTGDLSARIGKVGTPEFRRLANTFDTMASRLEDNDRLQREFLADLGHEIATPLNTLAGITVWILETPNPSPAEREQAVELLETELDRVRSLLFDIRRLSLGEALTQVRNEPVDLDAVCQRSYIRFQNQAKEAGISFSLRSQDIQIRSDQRLIETVLDNLLSNAIRYTPKGGKIELIATKTNTNVVLSVIDTGLGISPENQSRIFERFYRTDAARDRQHGGTGLGLAIAQRASLALGGHIEVDSAIGKGSTFRLILPKINDRQSLKSPNNTISHTIK